jgi:hypothetical protein
MLSYRSSDQAGPADPFSLEEGEQPLAPPVRVILWGDGQSVVGGPLLVTDRNLRFSPAWSGLEAITNASAKGAAPATLTIGRDQVTSAGWTRVTFFLRGLRLALRDGREFVALTGSEGLAVVAGALGVAS